MDDGSEVGRWSKGLCAGREGGALTAMAVEGEVVATSEYRVLQNQVRELQRLLGKKTMKAEILKNALEVASGSKNRYCGRCRGRRTVHGEGDLQEHRPIQCRRASQGSRCSSTRSSSPT